MSDILKQVEEALEPFAAFGDYIAAHPRKGLSEMLYSWDGLSDIGVTKSALINASAALTALRGLEWKPIAEMEDDSDNDYYVGRWGIFSGGFRWEQALCPGISPYAKPRLIERGYTHFCRPILPTPPKREVDND